MRIRLNSSKNVITHQTCMETRIQPESDNPSVSPQTIQPFQIAESRTAHFIFLGLCLLLLSFVSWRKTAEVITDFGMQLYIPWQIIEGKDLYRDIAWKHGPFSQYFNALLFQIFGASLTTLLVANTCLTATLTWLIYRIFHFLSDRLTALTAASLFLFLFAFSAYTGMGNWNFITPYTHEATHGTFLAVGMISALIEYQRKTERRWLVVVGLVLGAIALTKLEFLLAALAVVTVWFSPGVLTGNRRCLLDVTIVTALAFAIIGLMFGILAFRLSPGPALHFLVESWTTPFRSDPMQTAFYRGHMGIDKLWRNLWFSGMQTFGVATTTAAILGLEVFGKGITGGRTAIKLGLVVLPLALVAAFGFPFNAVCAPFPLLCLGGMAFGIRKYRQHSNDADCRARALLLCAWSVLGFVFLLKIFFLIRIQLYGFIHCLPAMMLAIGLFTGLLPASLKRKGYGGDFARTFFLTLVIIGGIAYFNRSNTFFLQKNFQIGPGADSLIVAPPELDSRGKFMAITGQILAERLKPGDTVAVIPEGVLLNYWLKTPTPGPYLAYTPYDLTTFGGEAATLARLKQTPPTFVVLVHRTTAEWNIPDFGTTPAYGQDLMRWIREDFRETHCIGAEPFTSNQFGIAIYERKSK